jgi:hypothetical protein
MSVRLKLFLRVCAVASSLLVVTALVTYRAGAWGWLMHAESTAVAASPSPDEPTLLAGTKSAPIKFLPMGRLTAGEPRARPQATPTKSPKDAVIFGGSKSFIIDASTPAPARRSAEPKP